MHWNPSKGIKIFSVRLLELRQNFRLERRHFFLLACSALVYAFLAGLRTVSDSDLGWHLATGRWVAQHHSIPSTDVLSYTAWGQPWIYPVGAGLIFYAAYLLGGYALISWIGAAACVGTVALLLRRGSAVSAGIAILAIPLIAYRTAPRADMFTVVLFAAFLSLLWENYETGHARLWLLPVLMVAWVNLHFGFAAGLGLMVAYVGIELSETVLGKAQRHDAMQRLRHASGWLLCTVLATLVNPWGWGIYRALIRQGRANPGQQFLIGEWTRVPVNWSAFGTGLWLRQGNGAIYALLAIAVFAAAMALLRAQFGTATVLLAATYPAVSYVRMGAVFACVVVVVGGAVLTPTLASIRLRIRPVRIRSLVTAAAVALLAALALLRSFDLVTNRAYFKGTDATTFGAGLGWGFPQRGAEFIERENLPGEIFNTYGEGGFVSWRLGPYRRDYIDGRDTLFGLARIRRHNELLESAPDSAVWEEEASTYNINTVLLPIANLDPTRFASLQNFCTSKAWQPVYLDEVSAVFVRRTPQTAELLQRFPVNCATAPLPAQPPGKSRAEAFRAWANAAGVLAALDRNSEALTAVTNALSIFPDSGFLHVVRANVLFAMGRLSDSEQEYLAGVALDPNEFTWSALASTYRKRGRTPAAIAAIEHAADVSPRPQIQFLNLGYAYLETRPKQPEAALEAFDQAVRSAPRNMRAIDNGTFDALIAQGRSMASEIQGNLDGAIAFQNEASRLLPDSPNPLIRLAGLYRLQGRLEEARRTNERAARIRKNTSH
jgi:tetratricopeptide (TPR) repeat protein